MMKAILGTNSAAMPKALTISGMVVSALVLLIFVLDLFLGWPFGTISMMMDIGFILCAGGLGYMSWSAYQDVK
jgi:hypothetical protein